MKILLAASSGGHYEQILRLKKLEKTHDITLVTERTSFTTSADYYLNQVNRRSLMLLIDLFINLIRSVYILFKIRPKCIISTGALCTIPLIFLGKIFKIKIVFIESFAKVDTPTLTGKLIYKIADLFIIQWPGLKKVYPNAVYGGAIY